MSKRLREHSVQAHWWKPEIPDHKLAGVVRYGSCQGFGVELTGAFFSFQEYPRNLSANQTIWGETISGKAITLFNALQTSLTTHSRGTPISSLEALQGVVGGHYEDDSKILVHTVDIAFEYLTEWSQISSIQQSYAHDLRTLTLIVSPADSVEIAEIREIKISVVPSTKHSHSGDQITLTQTCQLRLASIDALPFADFDSIISSFSKFLSLAVGEPAKFTKISARTPEKIAEVDGEPIWKEIEIIRTYSLNRAKREVEAQRMLFTLVDLQNNELKVFQQFLEKEKMLEPVFDLFFPTYFFDLPPPQEVLNMAHAIEAFHRSTIGGEYMPEDTYRNNVRAKLSAAIPTDICKDFKSSLERRLDFMHQFSLKRRLKDILRNFDAILKPFIGNRDSFIQLATDARNRLVHASIESPAPDYDELWQYAQQLGLIVETALLSEIGFRDNSLIAIVKRSKRANLITSNIIS